MWRHKLVPHRPVGSADASERQRAWLERGGDRRRAGVDAGALRGECFGMHDAEEQQQERANDHAASGPRSSIVGRISAVTEPGPSSGFTHSRGQSRFRCVVTRAACLRAIAERRVLLGCDVSSTGHAVRMLPPTVEASFKQLVGAFAARDPLPAGGAAGVTAIAMGVGLGIKVLGISSSDGTSDSLQQRLQELLERLTPEFATDCAAFAGLLDALRLPASDARRGVKVRDAWREATAAPVSVALGARDAESVLMECATHVKSSVRADLEAALELVATGRRIAERNARENSLRLDPDTAKALLAPLNGKQ